MFAVFATEFLHAVNSLTIFLNCHTHRLRMVISIEQYLKAEGRVVLLPGSPPAIDVAYAKECISYFSRWGSVAAGRFNNSKRDSSKAKKTASWCENDKRTKATTGFFTMVGSGFDVNSKTLYLYVGDQIITPELTAAKVEELASYVVDCMLAPHVCITVDAGLDQDWPCPRPNLSVDARKYP